MPRKRKTASRGTRRKTSSRSKSARASRQDAISLLKADHRQVEGWFEQFQSSRSESKKRDLANRICEALTVHTTLEEEIFYPAFYEATSDKEIHHEAEIEHAGAKKLIEEIRSAGPTDEYFDARLSVLSEMIKHHVREEEKRTGMFGKARESDMDLQALGAEIAARKAQLMRGVEAEEDSGMSAGGRRSTTRNQGTMAHLAKRLRGE